MQIILLYSGGDYCQVRDLTSSFGTSFTWKIGKQACLRRAAGQAFRLLYSKTSAGLCQLKSDPEKSSLFTSKNPRGTEKGRFRAIFYDVLFLGKGSVNQGLFRRCGKERNHGDNYEACYHGQGAAINGGLEQTGEGAAEQEICQH